MSPILRPTMPEAPALAPRPLFVEDLCDLGRFEPQWIADPTSLDDWLFAAECAARKLVRACFDAWAAEHKLTKSEALDRFLPPRPRWRDKAAARRVLAATMQAQAGEWDAGCSWRRSATEAAVAELRRERAER